MSRKCVVVLPIDLERLVHTYLRITEIFNLLRISKSWDYRIGNSLRSISWDAVHERDVDPAMHIWIEHLSKARVNLRSVSMVSSVATKVLDWQGCSVNLCLNSAHDSCDNVCCNAMCRDAFQPHQFKKEMSARFSFEKKRVDYG